MAKAKNKNLNAAGKAKEDEFYTKISDIEKELKHYRSHFKDKIVFCNCDDPETSNFWRYFQLNFGFLELRKLIATHYEKENPSYKIEYSMIPDDHGQYSLQVIQTKLEQNGDFRSPECIEILKEADIVVTNPPFSLFKEYITQLIEYDKKFIVIGRETSITNKSIWKYLKDNKIWLGYQNGDMEFIVPDYYKPRKTRYREENGIKYRSLGNACWFTNLDILKRHEDLKIYKKFDPDDYRMYDNYDVINVNKLTDIPDDYYEIMGVPITLIHKHNPEQFELIGLLAGNTKGLAGIPSKTGKDGPYIDGKLKFGRVLVRRIKK